MFWEIEPKYLRSHDPLASKQYVHPFYSLKDIKTFRLEWRCEQPEFYNVGSPLRESYCRYLRQGIVREIRKRFPSWTTNGNYDDLVLQAELEGVWAGHPGARSISQKYVMPVIYLKIIRWDIVVARRLFQEPVFYYDPFAEPMDNDDALFSKIGAVANKVVDFVEFPRGKAPVQEDEIRKMLGL